jgi:hypothetical protein
MEKTHDHQDWHQRLRPHRTHGVPRAMQNFADIEVVGINDLLEPDYLAYMLQYDSVHGRFKGDRQRSTATPWSSTARRSA